MTVAPPRPVTPASILAARLTHLAERLGGTSDVSGEVRELAELAVGLDAYPGRWSSPQSNELAVLAAATHEHNWSDSGGLEQEMLSGHVEGRFLAMLVHALRATRVLEIGMFTGYSALAMAEALPDDGVVVACELDADVAEFAQRQFAASPAGSRIEVRVGPAIDTLQGLIKVNDTFDLIFIDADKGGYEAYLAALLDGQLLAPHGLLCVDNTLLQGQPWTGQRTPAGDAIARFNEALAADPRVEQVIVPLRDGVTLARWADGSS